MFKNRGYLLTILVAVNLGACQAGRLVLGLLTEPIKSSLLLSDAQIGTLAGVSVGIAYSIFLLPAARIADRFNRRLCLFVAGIGCLMATILSAIATDFLQLLCARALVAASEACILSVTASLIADFLPATKRPMGFSLMTASVVLMISLAFVVSGWLEPFVAWRGVFAYFAGGYALILACVIILVRDPRRSTESEAKQTNPPSLLTVVAILIRKPTFLMLVGLACLYVFAVTAALTWTPAVLIRTHAFTQSAAANFMALSIGPLAGIAIAASGVVMTRARQRSVSGPLFVSMWVAFAVVTLYVSGLLAPGVMALVCLATALAVSPVVNSAILSSVQELAEPSYRATATALLIVPDSLIGGGAGALVTGLLSDFGTERFGNQAIRYALLISVGLSWTVSAFLYWRSCKHIRRDTPSMRRTAVDGQSPQLNNNMAIE